jgi:hypothetical protein
VLRRKKWAQKGRADRRTAAEEKKNMVGRKFTAYNIEVFSEYGFGKNLLNEAVGHGGREECLYYL